MAFTTLSVASDNPSFDDWVPDKQASQLCHGYYRQPHFPTSPSSPQTTTITSDSGEFALDGPSVFQGNVLLDQGQRSIRADRAKVTRDAQTQRIERIEAEGHVQILEPGLRLDSDHAEVRLQDNIRILKPASFRLYRKHARGTAEEITAKGDDYLELKQATYTTCAPHQNSWLLRAQEVTLNKATGRGVARHAWLEVKDTRVFYFPYVDFPIDDRRKTGFLYPSYASSNDSGLEVGVPFYWNTAPNYDLTVTPRWYSKRGLELHNQFRWLGAYPAQSGDVQFAFLPGDEAYSHFRADNLAVHPQFSDRDPRVTGLQRSNSHRYYLGVQQQARWSPNVQANFDYQTVSDDNYFMDFTRYAYGLDSNYLKQRLGVQYADSRWNGSVLVQQYKVLHPFFGSVTQDPYRQLPQLGVRYFNADLPNRFAVGVNTEFTHFSHKPDPMTGLAFTTGERYFMRPQVSWNHVHAGWFLKPRLQWHMAKYHLWLSHADAALKQPNDPHLTVPLVDVDSGLVFERPMHILKRDYVQTLEPRVYYLHVPFRDQSTLPNFDSGIIPFDYHQLYRDNRFSGSDRIGDTQQVTLGLSSRLLTAEDNTERLQLGIGQIFYFKNRRVSACNQKGDPNCLLKELPSANQRRSSIAAQGIYHWDREWLTQANLEWNPYLKKFDQGGVSMQYKPSDWNVVNLGMGYIRQNTAVIDPKKNEPERVLQTNVSTVWGITEQIRLLGRWYYDLEHRQSNQVLLGLEHQGCCVAVRFTVARTLHPYDVLRVDRKYTNRFGLQLVFKGFAGVGSTQMNGVLQQQIPGYQSRGNVF